MRFPMACGLALLAACQPNPAAPVKVMVIVPNVTGTYETRQVELTTISSITNLKGSVVNLVGGARIEINPSDPLLQMATSDQQIADVLLKDKGGDVRANYIDKSGVLWPADFSSWAMATTYFNFEQSFNYYQAIYDGADTKELLGTNVLYFASYKDLSTGQDVEIKDNAIFFSPVQSFLVLPFDKLQKIPLSLNIGVIGHEYAHLVFNRKAFAGAAIPPEISTWTQQPFNLLKSMDEGLADFHGYGVTCVAPGPGCRPAFLSASIDDKKAVAARDLSDPTHCMTEELRNAFVNFQPNEFLNAGLHYQVGTLIATALYQASNKVGKVPILQKALITSYDDPSAGTPGFNQVLGLYMEAPGNFTPELMADTIASHITDKDLARLVCTELTDRLQLGCATFPCPLMPHCPNTSTHGTSCPLLPPPTP